VGRVDVDDDGAVAQDGEGGDQILRAVRQHDPDAIAFDEPHRVERRGEPIGSVLDLRVGERRAEKRGRRPIRHVDRRRIEDLVERPPRIRQVVRDPIVVVPKPRTR
jgi:hypothetical protein